MGFSTDPAMAEEGDIPAVAGISFWGHIVLPFAGTFFAAVSLQAHATLNGAMSLMSEATAIPGHPGTWMGPARMSPGLSDC